MLFVISLQYMSFKIELSRICNCSSPCHLLPRPPAWMYYIDIRFARRGIVHQCVLNSWHLNIDKTVQSFFLIFFIHVWIQYLRLYSDYKYDIHRMVAFTSIIRIFVTASTKSLIIPFILSTSIWIYILVSAKTIFKMLVLVVNILILI